MLSTEYKKGTDGDLLVEIVNTESQTVEISGHIPYRHIRVSLSNDQLLNDAIDSTMVTIEVVSGLDLSRGDSPDMINYNGDVTVFVDDIKMTKTVTNGSVKFDLTTDKQSGSEIGVVAKSLTGHPSEPDSAIIEVVSE